MANQPKTYPSQDNNINLGGINSNMPKVSPPTSSFDMQAAMKMGLANEYVKQAGVGQKLGGGLPGGTPASLPQQGIPSQVAPRLSMFAPQPQNAGAAPATVSQPLYASSADGQPSAFSVDPGDPITQQATSDGTVDQGGQTFNVQGTDQEVAAAKDKAAADAEGPFGGGQSIQEYSQEQYGGGYDTEGLKEWGYDSDLNDASIKQMTDSTTQVLNDTLASLNQQLSAAGLLGSGFAQVHYQNAVNDAAFQLQTQTLAFLAQSKQAAITNKLNALAGLKGTVGLDAQQEMADSVAEYQRIDFATTHAQTMLEMGDEFGYSSAEMADWISRLWSSPDPNAVFAEFTEQNASGGGSNPDQGQQTVTAIKAATNPLNHIM